MAKFVEVSIDSLRVSLTNQQRIVVLKESGDDRFLPIWIGPYEAEAITIALQEIEVSRPQTHDLIKNTISTLGGIIQRVLIESLKDDIFYGAIIVERDKKEIKIDARPSDAIAVAVRAHVPILVAGKVMDEAGILPEEEPDDYEEMESEEISKNRANELALGEDRLSIFEDYLEKKPDDQQSGDDIEEDQREEDDGED